MKYQIEVKRVFNETKLYPDGLLPLISLDYVDECDVLNLIKIINKYEQFEYEFVVRSFIPDEED